MRPARSEVLRQWARSCPWGESACLGTPWRPASGTRGAGGQAVATPPHNCCLCQGSLAPGRQEKVTVEAQEEDSRRSRGCKRRCQKSLSVCHLGQEGLISPTLAQD